MSDEKPKTCPDCGFELEWDEDKEQWYCPDCNWNEEDEGEIDDFDDFDEDAAEEQNGN